MKKLIAALIFLLAISSQAHFKGPVLYVAAHPDDETMLGGILGRLKEKSIPTHVIYITRGEGSKFNLITGNPKDNLKMRPGEAREAATRYGIQSVTQLEETDAPMRDPVTQKPIQDVEKFLKSGVWNTHRIEKSVLDLAIKIKPRVILTMLPFHSKIHAHHQAAGQIALKIAKNPELKSSVVGVYGIQETNWYPEGTFESMPGQMKFETERYSPLLGKTYRAFQAQGAAAHATQESGHKGELPLAYEVLVPLEEKNGSQEFRELILAKPEEKR